MRNVELNIDGIVYNSCGSEIVIMPGKVSRYGNHTDDLEVRLNMYDDEGKKYQAEFIVQHAQVLMNCDHSEYFDFVTRKSVPINMLNESNLYDIVAIENDWYTSNKPWEYPDCFTYDSDESLLSELSIHGM